MFYIYTSTALNNLIRLMNAKHTDLRRPEPTCLRSRAKTKTGIERVRAQGAGNMDFDAES